MLTIRFDSRRFDQDMDRVAKQMRFAMARALTQTAVQARGNVQKALRGNLDRPTPYTVRSPRFQRATRDDLQAIVYIDGTLRKGATLSPAELLAHQFSGGQRRQKRMESWLRAAGFIAKGEYVTPGDKARLDAYGNMRRSQVKEVFAALEKYRSSGRLGRAVRRAARKLRGSRSKDWKDTKPIFWSFGGHLERGAYYRRKDGGLDPLLIVQSRSRYKQRIDMLKIVQTTRDRHLPKHFAAALEDALRTAR